MATSLWKVKNKRKEFVLVSRPGVGCIDPREGDKMDGWMNECMDG